MDNGPKKIQKTKQQAEFDYRKEKVQNAIEAVEIIMGNIERAKDIKANSDAGPEVDFFVKFLPKFLKDHEKKLDCAEEELRTFLLPIYLHYLNLGGYHGKVGYYSCKEVAELLTSKKEKE